MIAVFRNVTNGMVYFGELDGDYISNPAQVGQNKEGQLTAISLNPFSDPKIITGSCGPINITGDSWLELKNVPENVINEYRKATSGIEMVSAGALNNLSQFNPR